MWWRPPHSAVQALPVVDDLDIFAEGRPRIARRLRRSGQSAGPRAGAPPQSWGCPTPCRLGIDRPSARQWVLPADACALSRRAAHAQYPLRESCSPGHLFVTEKRSGSDGRE